MKSLRLGALVIAALLASGCEKLVDPVSTTGGSGASSAAGAAGSSSGAIGSSSGASGSGGVTGTSGSGTGSSSGATTATSGVACASPGNTLYVSVNGGGSTANGSMNCPFQTITEALAAALTMNSVTTISVGAGTYSNEAFPLVVPTGITLEGEDSSSRNNVVIDGSGTEPVTNETYTINLRGTLSYLVVKSSSGNPQYIVLMREGTPHIQYVTVDGKRTTAAAVLATSLAVSTTEVIDNQTEIHNSDSDGLLIKPSTTGVLPTLTVNGAMIHDNAGNGVNLSSGSATGPAQVQFDGSRNPNSIYCNKALGFLSDAPITAASNHWGHDPATISTSNSGQGFDVSATVAASTPRTAVDGGCN